MSITLYSSTGCLRCSVVKNFLSEQHMDFEEHDIQTTSGNTAFKQFYAKNRPHIRRDAHGIFFPLVQVDDRILQDAGSTLAWFVAGECLQNMVRPNNLGHGWTGGLYPDEGDASCITPFLQVIRFLKKGGLHTELETKGYNTPLLQALLAEGLVDRLCVQVLPPILVADQHACEESFRAAHAVVNTVDVRFYTDIAVPCSPEKPLLTAEETATAAQWLNQATGSNKLAYTIRNSDPTSRGFNLLPIRTAARRWQVNAEICKSDSTF